MKKFNELGLNKKILKSIESMGYEEPTEIQETLIPLILEGKDLIGQAETGSGKTLSYASSILSSIDISTNFVRAIILTPTRELALQVKEEFELLNKETSFDIAAVYGGSSIDEQIKHLRKGVDVVVGTPGRVMDLIRRNKLNIDNIEYFVLDEADEMLNMGFLEDIESIFKNTNPERQVLMLSATMPDEIKYLAERYMRKDYEHILIESETKTATNVKQYYYLVNEKVRTEVLCRVLDLKNSKRTIIFCKTKKEVDELLTSLSLRGYNAEAMHGDISQDLRIKTLDRFKNGAFKILIATDVAARGIHVENIECVINYNLPQDRETYIHRVGRTGRAGKQGEAISLVSSKKVKLIDDLEKFTNSTIERQELPSTEEIVKLKYNQILEEANNLDKETIKEAIEYVRDLNKGELLNLAASLLKITVEKELGLNLKKVVEVREDKKEVLKGTIRVFINIGKKDGLKKGSLLDFLKDQTKIRKENFNNIEILSTFTFIDVNEKVVSEFMKKIQNKKYKDRTIRIEKAKKQR